jgi:transcriptional regulator with XRE-family HTH domain
MKKGKNDSRQNTGAARRVTPAGFGRFLRKLRIDRGEPLKDMAAKLQVTPSYLSAVETGKRNIPDAWADQIAGLYQLGQDGRNRLRETAAHSAKTVSLPIEGAESSRKETAILFAREFAGLDNEQLTQIRNILKNGAEKTVGQ